MNAILINASPRKNGNTATLLERVREGLEEEDCETKTVHLGALSFTGCKGCLACKVKGSKCNGLCALRDDLRPVLEEVLAADILVLGSPVDFHYPTALARAFTERLLFAPLDYENPGASVLSKKIRCATLYTMHVFNDDLFEKQGYDKTLAVAAKELEFLGPAEGVSSKQITSPILWRSIFVFIQRIKTVVSCQLLVVSYGRGETFHLPKTSYPECINKDRNYL